MEQLTLLKCFLCSTLHQNLAQNDLIQHHDNPESIFTIPTYQGKNRGLKELGNLLKATATNKKMTELKLKVN